MSASVTAPNERVPSDPFPLICHQQEALAACWQSVDDPAPEAAGRPPANSTA